VCGIVGAAAGTYTLSGSKPQWSLEICNLIDRAIVLRKRCQTSCSWTGRNSHSHICVKGEFLGIGEPVNGEAVDRSSPMRSRSPSKRNPPCSVIREPIQNRLRSNGAGGLYCINTIGRFLYRLKMRRLGLAKVYA
jgi:hypothetical protein